MTDSDLAKAVYGDSSNHPESFGIAALLTPEQRAELKASVKEDGNDVLIYGPGLEAAFLAFHEETDKTITDEADLVLRLMRALTAYLAIASKVSK